MKKLKTRSFTPLIPLILLVICFLAYGVMIPELGYYWDDWPYAWINHMFGPAGYPAFVSSDRPHSAWIFMGLTTLLGERPLGYQISGLLLYWLCAVLFWLLLRMVWPRHEKEALWAAMIFTVYPGFLGHPNALIYNHHFAAMALYLFSFIAMVRALGEQGKRWWWHIPAVLALVISQFSIEYYIGWEAARLIVIWVALTGNTPDREKRLSRSIIALMPYWLATLGFLAWRVLVLGFPSYEPLGGEGIGVISKSWLLSVFEEILDAVVLVWRHLIPPLGEMRFTKTFWLGYIALSLAGAGFTFVLLFLRGQRRRENERVGESSPQSFALPALAIGLLGVLFAGVPFWLAGLPIRVDHPTFSRFTLAFIPWTALLVSVFLHSMARVRWRWGRIVPIVLLAMVVGGSVGWHNWNANVYRNDWKEMQGYFYQLVRRIPDLEPGTTLIINDMKPLNLYSDNSLTAVLNWTYSPDKASTEMDYMMYYLSVRLGLGLPALEPGLPIDQQYRSLHFSGSTDKLLVVYYQPPGCLRVLGPDDANRIPDSFPEEMHEVLPLSDLSLIRADSTTKAQPPQNIFDLEPPTSSFCFAFQEADLAAQQGDWTRVAAIGEKAFAGEDVPNELTEYFVFVEGYLRAGQPEEAIALSQQVSELSGGGFDERLCHLWRSTVVDTPVLSKDDSVLIKAEELFCNSN
jgi:hypothetical protein